MRVRALQLAQLHVAFEGMAVKVAWCGAQLVHSNHPHTSLGEVVPGTTIGLEGPDRLQQVRPPPHPPCL